MRCTCLSTGCGVRVFVKDVLETPLFRSVGKRRNIKRERKRRKEEVERSSPCGLLGVVPPHTVGSFHSLCPNEGPT